MNPVAFFTLAPVIVCGALLLLVLAVEWTLRWLIPSREQSRRLLKDLHRATAAGEPLPTFLRRQLLLRPFPLDHHMALAVADLEDDPGRRPLEVLADRKVLPPDARLALGAVAGEDDRLQAACLAGLAEGAAPVDPGSDAIRVTSFYLLWLVLAVLLLLFNAVVIVPKWLQIMAEVGLQVSPFLDIMGRLGQAEWSGPLLLALAVMILGAALLRWCLRHRRLQRGVLLLAGAERNLDEGRLAALLAGTFRRPPSALAAAGAAGDFAALCRSCRCPAEYPAGLGRFIDRTRDRLRRRSARAALAARILLPVVLGLVVLLCGLAYFDTLANILMKLG